MLNREKDYCGIRQQHRHTCLMLYAEFETKGERAGIKFFRARATTVSCLFTFSISSN